MELNPFNILNVYAYWVLLFGISFFKLKRMENHVGNNCHKQTKE